jgi:hypothetical protein
MFGTGEMSIASYKGLQLFGKPLHVWAARQFIAPGRVLLVCHSFSFLPMRFTLYANYSILIAFLKVDLQDRDVGGRDAAYSRCLRKRAGPKRR